MKDFDNNIDYFNLLKDSELFDGEYPLLSGLQRLAREHRGGVKKILSRIHATPTNSSKVASVTVTYVFFDGTEFDGSADATIEAHKKPYGLHLVAMADAKAESRALRRAFNISKASIEEIGRANNVVGNPDDGPIEPHQLSAIKILAKKKKIPRAKVLSIVEKEGLEDINKLTAADGRKIMQRLNTVKDK